ncbi:MAG: NAD(P)/FAD-dependent oxidoreductase [Bryobacteraceae bacterium]
MPAHYDVAVVGGGPAGLATAIEAARRGLRTVVLDGREPPIDKACGEGLLPDAIERLTRLGVTIPSDERGLFRGIEFSDERSQVAAAFPSGNGWGVKRTTLQQLLAKEVERAGVHLFWNTPVRAIEDHQVVCRHLRIEARWIVGADGLHSQVRRWAGLDGTLWSRERVAFRQHFGVQPFSEYVQVLWSGAGQCYVTPVGVNEISVAVITNRRHAEYRELLACFPSVGDRLPYSAASANMRGCLTASRRLRRVWTGHIALVGDASGSVDAITGEGICVALRQAEAVAEAIQAGDLRLYSRKHHGIMRRPALMAGTLCILSRHDGLRRRVMRALSEDPQWFGRMLGFHVGTSDLRTLGLFPSLKLGTRLLTLSPLSGKDARPTSG